MSCRSAYTRKRFRNYYSSSEKNSPLHANASGLFSVGKNRSTSPKVNSNHINEKDHKSSKQQQPDFEYPFSELLVSSILLVFCF